MTEQDDKTIIRVQGEWYEVGELEREPREGQEALSCDGSYVLHRHGSADSVVNTHTLTPCAAPKAYILGEEVLEAAGKYRERVERVGFTEGGETIMKDRDSTMTALAWWVAPYIILSPPEPEPQTAEELLAELAEAVFHGSYKTVTDLANAAQKYGEQKKD